MDIDEEMMQQIMKMLVEIKAVFERERVHDEETAIHSLKDDRNETSAYNEATEKIETDPVMMQSAEEHQDIPNEDATAIPVEEPRKWRRVQNLAAEQSRHIVTFL
jgi:hypothetical protein